MIKNTADFILGNENGVKNEIDHIQPYIINRVNEILDILQMCSTICY